jgi:hypothetical protein
MAIESVLMTDWALAKQNRLNSKVISNCFVILFYVFLFALFSCNFGGYKPQFARTKEISFSIAGFSFDCLANYSVSYNC